MWTLSKWEKTVLQHAIVLFDPVFTWRNPQGVPISTSNKVWPNIICTRPDFLTRSLPTSPSLKSSRLQLAIFFSRPSSYNSHNFL